MLARPEHAARFYPSLHMRLRRAETSTVDLVHWYMAPKIKTGPASDTDAKSIKSSSTRSSTNRTREKAAFLRHAGVLDLGQSQTDRFITSQRGVFIADTDYHRSAEENARNRWALEHRAHNLVSTLDGLALLM